MNPSASVSPDDADGRVSKEVHYFLLEWVDAEPLERDGEMDRVYWCSIAEAQRKLSFETEQRAMGWARARLENG